jgi:hypothetical protein
MNSPYLHRLEVCLMQADGYPMKHVWLCRIGGNANSGFIPIEARLELRFGENGFRDSSHNTADISMLCLQFVARHAMKNDTTRYPRTIRVFCYPDAILMLGTGVEPYEYWICYSLFVASSDAL